MIGPVRWVIGFLVGASWSSANLILLLTILKISVLEKPNAKLPALLMLKFPLLYLFGFFILNLKFFPLWSLLAGLLAVLPVVGAYRLWPKRA